MWALGGRRAAAAAPVVAVARPVWAWPLAGGGRHAPLAPPPPAPPMPDCAGVYAAAAADPAPVPAAAAGASPDGTPCPAHSQWESLAEVPARRRQRRSVVAVPGWEVPLPLRCRRRVQRCRPGPSRQGRGRICRRL